LGVYAVYLDCSVRGYMVSFTFSNLFIYLFVSLTFVSTQEQSYTLGKFNFFMLQDLMFTGK